MSKMTKRTALKWVYGAAILVGGGLVLAAGCKKKDKQADYPPQQATWGTPDAGYVAQDAAPPPPPPVDAAPAPVFDDVTKAQLAAQIEARAAKEAPGMKPVGEVFGAVLPQGGTVDSGVFQIDLGKCYTVIAQGGMGVTELDAQLKGAQLIPGMAPTLAVDNTTGAAAAITPCWKNGYPVGFPATASLMARGGSGAVAARVYVK